MVHTAMGITADRIGATDTGRTDIGTTAEIGIVEAFQKRLSRLGNETVCGGSLRLMKQSVPCSTSELPGDQNVA
jgi:hypothetical protein